MKEQSEKISKQFETISQLGKKLEELKNSSLRKTLIFENIKYQQAKMRAPGQTPSQYW